MTAAHAAGVADAMGLSANGASGGGASQTYITILMFGAMFAIFYFLMIRPQQKQRQERDRMLAAIKRGDRVVTTGGLYGTITGLTEDKVVLRVAEQVRLEFDRSAIGRVVETPGDKDA